MDNAILCQLFEEIGQAFLKAARTYDIPEPEMVETQGTTVTGTSKPPKPRRTNKTPSTNGQQQPEKPKVTRASLKARFKEISVAGHYEQAVRILTEAGYESLPEVPDDELVTINEAINAFVETLANN